jgi:hypothetical protein
MHIPDWDDHDVFEDRLDESLSARIKAELDPLEYLLWADRPAPPRAVRIPFVPVLFVAVVAGLSGFSLAAMFGLVNQAWIDPRTLAVALGLAPCILGGMILAHTASLVFRRWLKGRRLARTIYAVTDRRAIVARIESPDGELRAASLRAGELVDTRRFENPDGSGDLFFLGTGQDQWLPIRFLEVPRVGLVESLVREALLDREQEQWESGTTGSF